MSWVQLSNSRVFVLTESCHCFELHRTPQALNFTVNERAAPPFNRRCLYAICAMREELIVITGGCGGLQSHYTSCLQYKVDQNRWSDLPAMNQARRGHSSSSFNQRFVYVFGGTTRDDEGGIEKLDIRRKEQGWQMIAQRLAPNYSLPLGLPQFASQLDKNTICFLYKTSSEFFYVGFFDAEQGKFRKLQSCRLRRPPVQYLSDFVPKMTH